MTQINDAVPWAAENPRTMAQHSPEIMIPDRPDTATRILHDWWEHKRGGRSMPTRAELDPAELTAILRSILLIGIDRAPAGDSLAFNCRLAGTEVDSRLGISLTGLSLDTAPIGAARDSVQRQYEAAVRERRPVFCSHNMVVNGRRYVEYDRLVVPLAGAPDGAVSTLVAALDFHCAYPIERGRPPDCSRQAHCDRIDLCLAPHGLCEAATWSNAGCR